MREQGLTEIILVTNRTMGKRSPTAVASGRPVRTAIRRMESVDAVFRRLLRKPDFTWSGHGDALLRRRKPWYYENEPRPGVSVIGDRLSKLLRLPR